jgi:phytoene dehydrogenase-like protein
MKTLIRKPQKPWLTGNNRQPKTNQKTVIIIGAGIAGLSAGIYAQMNGYKSRIYEMHTIPGGVLTAWRRNGYLIDGCIHWLAGSNPRYPRLYRYWQEIGLIQGRQIFDPDIFFRIEDRDGQVFNLYCNVDRLEQHMLDLAPEDEKTIREVCKAIRKFGVFKMSPADPGFLQNLETRLQMMSSMPQIIRFGKMTMKDFGEQFQNPFLRRVFSEILWEPNFSAFALLITLSNLNDKTYGYPLGGSLPMALAVAKRYRSLGGEIHFNTRVSKILIENNRAVGIRLEDGREERADVVISAADGHATLFHMLEDRYTSDEFRAMYADWSRFTPLVFIGLGVNRIFDECKGMTGGLLLELGEPLVIGGKPVEHLEVRILDFDPFMAPAGKTVLTLPIPTDYNYWSQLYGDGSDRKLYDAVKQTLAKEVIRRLDLRFPGLAEQVEMVNVATPLTFERYTGNWQGCYEGWSMTPGTFGKMISKKLPGLDNFYMVGQWVQAGGGLPSGVMTSRQVVKEMCQNDGRRFQTQVVLSPEEQVNDKSVLLKRRGIQS